MHPDIGREQLQAEVLAHTATAADRDRLQRRTVWLRRAYSLLHRRRRATQWILRDIDNARRNVKTERDRYSQQVTELTIRGMGLEGQYHEAVEETALWRDQATEWQRRAIRLGERLVELENEQSRWRLVITAAQEFTRTQAAWREQVGRGEPVTDDVAHRRAAATATLLLYVRDLDAKDAWAWTCACGQPTALTRCATCGMDRPPRPEARLEETTDG